MKYCSRCGKEISNEAIVCPNCLCEVVNPTAPKVLAGDEISIGLCVLAALIPLFGIIYWPLKHKETPKKARACGITGIVSWVICFFFELLIAFAIGFSLEFIEHLALR